MINDIALHPSHLAATMLHLPYGITQGGSVVSGFGLINEVNRHSAQLVLSRVTV